MADEENQQTPEQPEGETPATEAPEPEVAPDAPAEEPAAEAAPEEPAAEEAAADEPAADEAPAAPAAEAPAEQQEVLPPKQRRKLSRSRASGPANPPRTQEERLAARAAERRRKAAERQRWRAKQRAKHAAAPRPARAEEPAAVVESGARKERQGVVTSDKGEKTITVRIDSVRRHRLYQKVLRESQSLHAHDENNEAGEGDVVRLVECRPLSRTKRWRLVEVLEKAK
jgi:small subunit ribosomal protein S17